MFLLLLHDRRHHQVQNQGHRTSGIDVHRPYLCQRHHRHCSLDMFSCVCLEGEQELVRSLLKRTLAAEKFANQIANQPCKSRIASKQRRKIVFSQVNRFIRAALIAAIVILLPAILHAQQGTPEAIAPLPGIGWQGPPGEVEWEPIEQGGLTDGGAQDHVDAREQHDEATKRRQEPDLMAQQAMAEQARRMADLMFWQTFFQTVIGVALLIGLGATLYYVRQIARGDKFREEPRPTEHNSPGQPYIQSKPAAGTHVNQQGSIKF